MNEFPLNTIYFYLTEGCNLKCRHCWIEPKYTKDSSPELSLELFESIIQQAIPLGLNRVKLTGGEPLLHSEILGIIDFIREQKLGLWLETNGLLCSEKIADAIASCGSAMVAVSLDAVDAELHDWVRGIDGAFEDAVTGIKNLVKAGVIPQIVMTIMRHNSGQIEKMVEFANSLGCGSVKFNVLQPTSRGEQMHKTDQSLTIQELVELGAWIENDLSKRAGIPIDYGHPIAFKPLSKILGKSGRATRCNIQNIIGVLSNGTFALCGIGEHIPELTFGHAERDKLSDVWNDHPMLQEIRSGLPDKLTGICAKCVMKQHCRGSCIAQNYYTNRNLWSSFWYCEQAGAKKLFPKSRIV